MSKTNLTLSLEDSLLRRARIKALEQGTSVNAVVRKQLEVYAGKDRRQAAIKRLLELAQNSPAGSGPEGRTWTREDLYEERLSRYGQSR